jgi:hypothetical protein
MEDRLIVLETVELILTLISLVAMRFEEGILVGSGSPYPRCPEIAVQFPLGRLYTFWA